MTGIEIIILLGGNAALLLWGARMVRTGFMRAYGAELRQGLNKNLSNRFAASFAGFFAALVLQSSTAVALLTTSFATAALIPISTGLAIMLGADIGAALVAQLLSLNIKALWPLLILIGYIIHNINQHKNNNSKQIGRILLGLGFLLLALNGLSLIAGNMQQSETLKYIVGALASDPIMTFIFAILITYFAHSSLAIILLISGLAAAGLVNNNLILPFIIGVNVGGAIPALIMTLKEGATSRSITLGNFLFRLILAILGVILINPLLEVSNGVFVYTGLDQITEFAIFIHLGFNIILFAIFIGLINPVAKILASFSAKNNEARVAEKPNYLRSSALDMPEIALNLAAREVLNMTDKVEMMLKLTVDSLVERDELKCKTAKAMDEEILDISSGVKTYLIKLSQTELEDMDSKRALEIIGFATSLDYIGNEVARNILHTIKQMLQQNKRFSVIGMQEIKDMYAYIEDTMQLAVKSFMDQDIASAREIIRRKELFRKTEYDNRLSHLSRLRKGDRNSLETSAFHMDILRDFKKINSYLSSTAYAILEANGELRHSRLAKS